MTKAMTIVALGTGMRFGEIRLLKREIASESNYVNFKDESIFIHKSLSKSGKSRSIPLRQDVAEVLSQIPKNRDSDYFFLNRGNRKPIGSIEKTFNTALKRAGIKDFHFHDCRHSFASRLAMAGVPLADIRDLLGHQNITMTERYAHLSASKLKESINKIDLQLVKNDREKEEFKQIISSIE